MIQNLLPVTFPIRILIFPLQEQKILCSIVDLHASYFCFFPGITVLRELCPLPKLSFTVLFPVTYVSSSPHLCSVEIPQLTEATSAQVFVNMRNTVIKCGHAQNSIRTCCTVLFIVG